MQMGGSKRKRFSACLIIKLQVKTFQLLLFLSISVEAAGKQKIAKAQGG